MRLKYRSELPNGMTLSSMRGLHLWRKKRHQKVVSWPIWKCAALFGHFWSNDDDVVGEGPTIIIKENNNRPNFSYWKYSRFDLVLLDDEVYKAKRHLIFSCFWSSLTIKTLNYNAISSTETHVTLFKIFRNHIHIFAIAIWRKLESKFKF